MIKPRKSLGQNFLTDKNIIRKIIDSIDPQKGETILEIGPGTGAITEELIHSGANLIAVELDNRAIEFLETKFPKEIYPNFRLIRSDILDIDLETLLIENSVAGRIKVVGNIPYYISGQLLFWMVDNYKHINKALLMVQKEVARRVATIRPGNKDYGLTSVVMALFADTQILFDISPNSFNPVPKVTSSFISFNFREIEDSVGESNRKVIKLAKSAFNQRRKMLRNSLLAYLDAYHPEISFDLLTEYFEEKGLSNIFTKRSDEINVQDYLTINELIESYRNRG